jgi:alpha-2-macroglobulin
MRKLTMAVVVAALALASTGRPPSPADFSSIRSHAERLVAERSYKLALEAYEAADPAALDAEGRRWLAFRLADLRWRSAPENADPSVFQVAKRDLERLVTDQNGVQWSDRAAAEALESLGDMQWTRREYGQNWTLAWGNYARALALWAASSDLDLARQRYLGIVWKASEGAQEHHPYGFYSQQIPVEVLENVFRIALTPSDRSRAAFLLASHFASRGDANAVERARQLFESAVAEGRGTEWYDDALFRYAEWLSRSGSLIFEESGQFRVEPDYEAAVATFRRFLAEFARGTSRYWDQARSQLDALTQPSLNAAVSNVFLPGSEIEFALSYRNVGEIHLSLVRVDLTRDVTGWTRGGSWIEAIDASRGTQRHAWTHSGKAVRRHAPGFERVRLDRQLAPGAWLLEVRSGGVSTREIILVSQAAIVTRTTGRRSLLWVTDARSGTPLPGAAVSVWQEVHDREGVRRVQHRAVTDGDGLAEVAFDAGRGGQLLVFASAKDHQAFAASYGYSRGAADREEWRIYATTDRPAYRPDETAKWKITARLAQQNGYGVPAGRMVSYEIRDPRGNSVTKGTLKLNAFGSAWAELPLASSMPLGPYNVSFESDGRGIGSATLFRLEEYKLPEFRVEVKSEAGEGGKRLFRTGDRVEAVIEASYYFGGPVANATVEALVYQSPYHRWWFPDRDYPWYFDEKTPRHYGGGGHGHIVKREILTTDAEGRARLSFETPQGEQDWQYRIEVKVTDASRREITAAETIRVTRSPYFAQIRPSHWLHQPGDSVEVLIRTVDANDQPVQATGTLRVTREEWHEVWLDPKGNEVSGRALEAIRARGSFPPPPEPGRHPWRLIRRGYEQEEISKTTVATDSEGKATFRFTAQREGYYRVAWASRPAGLEKPRPRDLVSAETTVWVATNATTRLGYFREAGVEVIVDRESVRPGATVPVMLVVPTADRTVLFSVEHEEILSREVVRTNGNVRLLQIQLGDQHIPNVFLTASMVMDLQLHQDTEELIVPPVDKFLTLELSPERPDYRPGERGRVTITARDAAGQPVQAEVSLAVADESVYAIQEEFAGDPRPFFYGQKRHHGVQTGSSFAQRPYVRLVDRDGQLIDERLTAEQDPRRERQMAGGVAGAMVDMSAQSVAEAITVTGAAPPPPAAPQAMKAARADGAAATEAVAPGSVQVRSDFRSTLFWQPDIVTDASGKATVDVDYADSLTTWRATARAATTASQFGMARASTRTSKPLIVRLQAPRFFVVGDQTVVSAVINNNTDAALTATPTLQASGVTVAGLFIDGREASGEHGPVSVPPHAESRVDWVVAAREPGRARLRVSANAGDLADAMERTYPVEDHGIDKLIAVSGKVRASEATLKLDLPRERRSTELIVQVTPSIAVTMLDAIPYLIDFPYGCTEQTMSRFLPAVIVTKTLGDLGLSRETVASRLFGGVEAVTTTKTHPEGRKDLQKLDSMVRAGLARLYDFQHGDGGWGWWKDGESDHFMSAYVVWGLALARDAGVDVRRDVLERGVRYLAAEVVEEELDLDRQAWLLHALSAARGRAPRPQGEQLAFDNVFKKRDRLSSYGLALLALTAHQYGLRDEALTLARNLENGAAIDRSPDASILVRGSGSGSDSVVATARWGARNFWWRWHEGPVESTATALRALAAIDPNHRLIEPAMNWLVKNRRGAQWSNTRDTALAVLALNDYLRTSGELAGDVSYEVAVNGTVVAQRSVAAGDAIAAPSRFVVPASAIRDANEIRIRRTGGSGALYVGAESRFFSLEEPVKAAGNEIFLKRDYARLAGRPTLLTGHVYDRVALRDGDAVRSGERVEVTITVEVKNDYEYLLLEDLKPAGLEAVELISGEPLVARRLDAAAMAQGVLQKEATARSSLPFDGRSSQPVYRELRDRKVALFIDRLDQGIWEIRYTLRAEVPGTFHALPVIGGAMYVPEIRGNSDEVRLRVDER